MRRYWEAVLGLLWVHGCLVTGMKVEQSPSALSLQEGASCTLKCNYSSVVNSVHLTRLFYIASGMKQSGRLNCTVNTKDQSSTLHVTASQLEDSATYLCAAEAQCSLVICSLPPNCLWACSTSTSLGRTCACTELHVFRFSDLFTALFHCKIRSIRVVVSPNLVAFFPRIPFAGKKTLPWNRSGK
ncbi:unnamed protein product [Nyctereutes procyonoides]|uniref:(raccoon dog) hypothetical protein n=1 Tax=Nyctereutes procyonoides TaxID=34880 RepID=A0A811XS06_NYCPR|nr:unnamed protein product [Nyctereutes procyonoides]